MPEAGGRFPPAPQGSHRNLWKEPHLANSSWSVSGISRLGFFRDELNFSLSFSTNSLNSLAQTFQCERMRCQALSPRREDSLVHQKNPVTNSHSSNLPETWTEERGLLGLPASQSSQPRAPTWEGDRHPSAQGCGARRMLLALTPA